MGPWQGEEINISSVTAPCWTQRLLLLLLWIFVWFCLFVLMPLGPETPFLEQLRADTGLFVAGTEDGLRRVFSSGLLACHLCPRTYLLKLSVLPDLGFLNPISDVVCWRIWPMFTTYCELHAMDTMKNASEPLPFLKRNQWITLYKLFPNFTPGSDGIQWKYLGLPVFVV